MYHLIYPSRFFVAELLEVIWTARNREGPQEGRDERRKARRMAVKGRSRREKPREMG